MNEARQLINKLIAKGHVLHGSRLYTPTQAKELNIEPPKKKSRLKRARTCDMADELNIANKEKHADQFCRLIEIELNEEVWPEYRFAKEKGYKLDYALPKYKVALEVQGGIWKKGLSGHSSGKGISRDMAKLNLLTANGWVLLQVTPSQLLTSETLELIKKAISNARGNNALLR